MCIELLFHGELILNDELFIYLTWCQNEPIFEISFAYTRNYEKQWRQVHEDHTKIIDQDQDQDHEDHTKAIWRSLHRLSTPRW